MKANKLIGAAIAAAMAFCSVTAVQSTGNDTRVYAEENGFIIETDADGDKYISGYTGSGGDIVIPSDVVWIGEKAFYKNTSITSVTIPKTCWYWIDKNAFKDCTSLRTVTFEGSIDGIGESAFSGCTSLERVTFGGDVGREDGSGGIGYRAFFGCSELKLVKFSDSSAKLDLIGEYAFMNCSSLNQLELPAGLNVIYNGAFLNCGALSVVSVPAASKLDGEHIFGYMYGSLEKGGQKGYAVADGKRKLYISDSDESTALGPVTLVTAKGSDAEKYASENGINFMYGVTPVSSQKLPAPANVKAASDTSRIVLKWDEVNNASGYRVYMYNPDSGKYETYKSVKTAKCTVTGLTAGTEYKFTVAALKGSNGRYSPGEVSGVVSCSLKKS